MIAPNRKELLSVLAELGAVRPEMRFGQLIANLATLAKGLSAEGVWDPGVIRPAYPRLLRL